MTKGGVTNQQSAQSHIPTQTNDKMKDNLGTQQQQGVKKQDNCSSCVSKKDAECVSCNDKQSAQLKQSQQGIPQQQGISQQSQLKQQGIQPQQKQQDNLSRQGLSQDSQQHLQQGQKPIGTHGAMERDVSRPERDVARPEMGRGSAGDSLRQDRTSDSHFQQDRSAGARQDRSPTERSAQQNNIRK